MKNKGDSKSSIHAPAVIRFNIDFISEESNRIKTSNDVRNRVIEICTYISTEILSKLEDKDGEKLEKQILYGLSKFDEVIKDLENDDNEKEMLFLLTSHVGDMLYAIYEKN